MRRLHTKNQQLVQRLAALERERKEDAAGAEVRRLRDQLRAREEEVRQLRESLQRIGGSDAGCVHRDGAADVNQRLATPRVKQVERQCTKLLERKVDAVLREDTKERIPAEVRELLVALKDRIITDARRHEAEVLLLNESLRGAERRLATA